MGIHDFHLGKAAENKQSGRQLEPVPLDIAWQRQQLERLFSNPSHGISSSPVQNISVTSSIQRSSLNHAGTELRLTVERKIHLDQGQARTIVNEVNEDVWIKGTQGWKLKHRTINEKGRWTDYS